MLYMQKNSCFFGRVPQVEIDVRGALYPRGVKIERPRSADFFQREVVNPEFLKNGYITDIKSKGKVRYLWT